MTFYKEKSAENSDSSAHHEGKHALFVEAAANTTVGVPLESLANVVSIES
jgi:hypothetical protein